MTTSHLQLPPAGQPDDGAELPDDQDDQTFDRHHVTAVVVSHDGARWLPRTLSAIGALVRGPDRTVVADTGSLDNSRRLVTAALGERSLVKAARRSGYGAAVNAAVELADQAHRQPADVEWLWLLHDDSAPDPDALRRLLAAVDANDSVAIAGPKVRGWTRSGELVEVGITVGASGRRETGLERHELDQGQHDGRRDVLAVGTAGMLIRRDVWDQLGGFDPGLPMFRDDLDLGWRANLAGHRVIVVPEAVIHHAEASAHGLRQAAAVRQRVYRADRRSAMRVMLANAPVYSVPWRWLRLLVGSLLRAFGLLLGKAATEAFDELVAAGSVLLNPFALASARRARARTRTVPAGSIRGLLAPRMSGVLHGYEVVAGVLARTTDHTVFGPASSGALESGPVSDEAEDLVAGPGRVRTVLTDPRTQISLLLTLVSLIAFRALAFGDGVLQGGALLPASDASSLWTAYASGWHEVGVGSPLSAPPYLVPVAALGTVLLGKAWLAVELLFILSVPLSGLVAFAILGRLVSNQRIRVLAAVGYALLPAVTGGIATGRLGVVVAAWMLPLTGWATASALGLGPEARRRDGRPGGSLSRAWGAGILLAFLVAFVPAAWPLALISTAAAVVLYRPHSVRVWARFAAVMVTPALLLAPWIGRIYRHPAAWLLGTGAPVPGTDTSAGAPPVWHLAVANPGGPGVPAAWVTLPLLAAGVIALLRSDRRRLIAAAWVVAGTGLAAGAAVWGRTVVPPSLGWAVPVWTGLSSLLVGGGLILAAAVGADGMRPRVAAYRFGWRQAGAALLSGVTILVPLVLVGSWVVDGVHGDLARGPADVLPAYVVATGQTPGLPRAVLLQDSPPGSPGATVGATTSALVSAQGRQLGDADVAGPATQTAALRSALASLLSGQGSIADVQTLARYGVGFVVVSAPVSTRLADELDQLPGLGQVSSTGSSAVWRLLTSGDRVVLVRPPASTIRIPADPTATVTTVDAPVPPPNLPPTSPFGRLDVAEAADPGWAATADGRPVHGFASGWQQVFAIPASAQRVTLGFDQSRRHAWLWAEGLALLVVVVFALPTRRSRGLDLVRSDSDVDPADSVGGGDPA
jgi:GT2 family glycosyltransferase